jgi:HEAT repeat protein
MPGKRSFDAQLSALEALRCEPSETAVKALRKALGQRNNYIVSKAAALVRELRLRELIPELLAAFDRFFGDPVKTDPQCWAKNAIAGALAALDCQDPDVFLRGMRHIQLEPVWGGSSDTAGTLRATCGLALVQCRSLPDRDLLAHLLELLADAEKTVRAEAVRAIAQVGSPPAALLLRLRAVLAGEEPEVLGACYSGILALEGTGAIPWLSRYLARGDDASAEAALAIAQDRSPEAFSALRERFESPGNRPANDPWFTGVLLSAMALTRREEAQDFLLNLLRAQSAHAEAAMEAILRSAPSPEIISRLEQLVAEIPSLARAFRKHRTERQ